MIPWREHSVPITIPKSALSCGPGRKAIEELLDDGIREIRERMRECSSHHPLFVTYRRYRRGKNRCKWCGCKL